MKYYAVTEDPNELFHYGRKGMKWGQHIFGDKPKSPGYQRALGKLRATAQKATKTVKNATGSVKSSGTFKNAVKTAKNAKAALKKGTVQMTKSVKSAIQKSSEQRAINKQVKQENNYNKAVERAQKRINLVSGLNSIGKIKDAEKQAKQQQREVSKEAKQYQREIDKEAKQRKQNDIVANLNSLNKQRAYENDLKQNAAIERKNEKAAAKLEKKYAKNERKMDKFTQLAREGRLQYGKLSDEQVQRITNRLGIERNARILGNTEKPSWRIQKKEALREGRLKGITEGTAAAMREAAAASVKLAFNRRFDKLAEKEAERRKSSKRIENSRTRSEINQDIKQEFREADRRANYKYGKKLQNLQDERREQERQRKIADSIADDRDREYAKLESDNKYNINNGLDMRNKYEKLYGRDATNEVFGKNNGQYNKMTEAEQKKLAIAMNKDNEKNKESAAYEEYKKVQEAQEKRRAIEKENDKKIDNYYKLLQTWESKGRRGPKPRRPKLTPLNDVPTISYTTYRNWSGLNLPSGSSNNNGGGGKKK